ncbi:MAG: hypothetical protein KJP00_00805 [Bacteroidia bacterium]|nr:hypothetical protein [Bacteroidia bacterium]
MQKSTNSIYQLFNILLLAAFVTTYACRPNSGKQNEEMQAEIEAIETEAAELDSAKSEIEEASAELDSLLNELN